jgi:glycosyltransferase involved in cell wall biosynthesis
LEEVIRAGYRRILVVDGYSTDKTIENLRSFDVSIVQQHGRGKTGALETALEHVSTPYILIMDGDFTYSAFDIERFLPHARHYDEIIAARKTSGQNPLQKSQSGEQYNRKVPISYRERVGKQKLSTWKDGQKMLSAVV